MRTRWMLAGGLSLVWLTIGVAIVMILWTTVRLAPRVESSSSRIIIELQQP
jgi:hypothetical protein